METLEIHSKSHLIKWVNAPGGSTIHWQVKPIKKSINFGLFRHCGDNNSSNNSINGSRKLSVSTSSQLSPGISITERLQNSGLEEVIWHGRCDAGVQLNGSYGVKEPDGGMFALVFDNTFSKTTAKTVLFSQQVEARPGRRSSKSAGSQAGNSSVSRSAEELSSPSGNETKNERNSRMGSNAGEQSGGANGNRTGDGSVMKKQDHTTKSGTPTVIAASENGLVTTEITRIESSSKLRPTWVSNDRYMTGVMLKKRRKKLQGYGRRYFSLDRKYGMLNYYLDQKSSFLRGSMPIHLCVITAIERTREIIIDSGMEVWSLKALNSLDWKAWTTELDSGVRKTKELRSARQSLAIDREYTPDIGSIGSAAVATGMAAAATAMSVSITADLTSAANGLTSGNVSVRSMEPSSLTSLDELIARLKDTSIDAKRTLAELDAAIFVPPPVPQAPRELQRKPSFWRRKSKERLRTAAGSGDGDSPSVSPDLGSGTVGEPISGSRSPKNTSKESLENFNPNVYNNGNGTALMAQETPVSSSHLVQEPILRFHDIVKNLDTLVGEFSQFALRAQQSKRMTFREDGSTTYRDSILSGDEQFFDADEEIDGVLYLSGDENIGEEEIEEEESEEEDEIEIEEGDNKEDRKEQRAEFDELNRYINRGQIKEEAELELELYPLSTDLRIARRRDIRPATCNPPSLIGLLRKNVGKDLTSVVMPVTCNEPITILQRFAELMEYSQLLDRAADSKIHECERALLIATFAVSGISSQRAKERSLRKPFNPLLGETFELVREDRNFRLIAEKVSHRPPVMAIQVESPQWVLNYTAKPDQKYWGKSMEVTDNGPVRIRFRKSGEIYEYLQASTFLRNIIAGEKYLEPAGTVNVVSSQGTKAIVEYKQGGMFSGRSEGLLIRATSKDGRPYHVKYEGKWTESISNSSSGQTVWSVGKLVSDYQRKYGFTEWTASLNEITAMEKDQLAPTDSRLRPDQQMYENGDIEGAEKSKLYLEEQQRRRRKEMEVANQVWQSVFFTKRGDIYELKPGKQNYWNRRQKQDWEGLADLW